MHYLGYGAPGKDRFAEMRVKAAEFAAVPPAAPGQAHKQATVFAWRTDDKIFRSFPLALHSHTCKTLIISEIYPMRNRTIKKPQPFSELLLFSI